MDTENRPTDQLSPQEIERQIDQLIMELGREGGEYETQPPERPVPWYRRLLPKPRKKRYSQ